MGLTASAVTKSLIPLERIGLVSRQREPRDARVGYASLTATGAQPLANATGIAEISCRDVYDTIMDEWNSWNKAAQTIYPKNRSLRQEIGSKAPWIAILAGFARSPIR